MEKYYKVAIVSILICIFIQSCRETPKINKGAYYGSAGNVDIQFQTGFKADTVILAVKEMEIYTSVLTTDWSLGYSDHTLINDSLFRLNGQLIIKVNKLQIIIKYKPNFRFININKLNADSLDIQFSNDPIQYM